MAYLLSAASISHQPFFLKKGFSLACDVLPSGSAVLHPDYKPYINAALLRRMSPIIRMSIACSAVCMQEANVRLPDSIIVGTGLGCLDDTEKFLSHSILIEGDLLPPTSFIQSTHNTIAGQISLIFQNHGYNMTHTQNSVSFERATEDAILGIMEGSENVLLGAADEFIVPLTPIAAGLKLPPLNLTTGASFFILSSKKPEANAQKITSVGYSGISNRQECLSAFLDENNVHANDIDLVLYARNDVETMFNTLKSKPCFDLSLLCGTYMTNSAFGVHLAHDILSTGTLLVEGKTIVTGSKKILVVNNLLPENLGLTLLEKE